MERADKKCRHKERGKKKKKAKQTKCPGKDLREHGESVAGRVQCMPGGIIKSGWEGSDRGVAFKKINKNGAQLLVPSSSSQEFYLITSQ